MKFNKTVIGVVSTLLIMWAAWISAEKANAEGVYVELGKNILNSDMTVHGLGYRYKSWGASIEATGQGTTKRGVQKVQPLFSVYHVTDPNWVVLGVRFKTILGMAYTPNQKLVGPTNFRLELVLEAKGGLEFFARHYSSAGLHKPNTGLDSIGIRKSF